MEALETPDRDVKFLFPAERGQFPVLSPEAVSKYGDVENIVPGDMRFVRSNTVVFDQFTRRVMVDTADFVPEEQDGMLYKIAVRKISVPIKDSMVEGYVVDARYGQFSVSERMSHEDGGVHEAALKFRPVAPLAIVYRNRLTDTDEATGVPGTESSLQLLMDEVDAIMAAQTKQPIAEAEPKAPEEGVRRQVGAIAGRALELCMPLFTSVIADNMISHQSAHQFVQKLKNG